MSAVLRAGDFFGPRPGNNWFSQALVKPGRPVRFITYPGAAGIGHVWAYLPDVAETFALLAEQESSLEAFAAYHFEGHWDPDGTAMTGRDRPGPGQARSEGETASLGSSPVRRPVQ